MQIGWIDFSRSDREKALSILEMLGEESILDELGISPIRDGFADIFFPGTSTLQTRAKYFFIVPYLLNDLDRHNRKVTQWRELQRMADRLERNCAEKLLGQGERQGVIGRRTLLRGGWVKRGPASIYWSGLVRYGIFCFGHHSLREYLRLLCALNMNALNLEGKGKWAKTEDEDGDDRDAGALVRSRFWDLPAYEDDWLEKLTLKLTREEGSFLKKHIIASAPDSLFAALLVHNIREVTNCEYFADLESLVHHFSPQIREDFYLALNFARFNDCLILVYNSLLNNQEAEEFLASDASYFPEIAAAMDLEALLKRLRKGNTFLWQFLYDMREKMLAGDLDGLREGIRKRERLLKNIRARTGNVSAQGEESRWFGPRHLQYRFGNALTLIKDIFESEE